MTTNIDGSLDYEKKKKKKELLMNEDGAESEWMVFSGGRVTWLGNYDQNY